MSLVVRWSGICEGAVADSRGSVTLVGAAPSYLTAERFPWQIRLVAGVMIDETVDDAERIFLPGGDAEHPCRCLRSGRTGPRCSSADPSSSGRISVGPLCRGGLILCAPRFSWADKSEIIGWESLL